MFHKFLYHCLIIVNSLIFCKTHHFHLLIFGLAYNSTRLIFILKCTISLFKGTNQTSLLIISLTHNKNSIPSFYLLIICISARTTLQALTVRDEYTLLFFFFNFPLISFCNFLTIVSYQKLHQIDSCSFASSRLFKKAIINNRSNAPFYHILIFCNI